MVESKVKLCIRVTRLYFQKIFVTKPNLNNNFGSKGLCFVKVKKKL